MAFDSEFEDAVLAQSLRDDNYARRAVRLAGTHHFGSKERAWVWKVIRETWEKYRERPTGGLLGARAKAEFKDPEKRKPYVALALKLARHKPESPSAALDELGQFVRQVDLQLSMEAAAGALERGDVEAAEAALTKASRARLDRQYTHIKWIEEFEERQELRKYEREHPEDFKIIPTGLSKLDKLLAGGTRVGEVGLVMGTTGRGKSIMLNNVCHAAVRRKTPSCYFALEMPARQIAARQDALWSRMRYEQFKQFDFKPSELRELDAKYKKALKAYANLFHIISMPVRSADIRSLISALEDLSDECGFKPTVIAVDSGDHMKATDPSLDSFRLQQAEVYWQLKQLAEEGGYMVWSSVHAGREWAEKVATAEATSESYDKSRIADLVVSMNDPFARESRKRKVDIDDEDDAEEPGEVEAPLADGGVRRMELYVAKYRDGASHLKIQLDCDFTRMLIREVESE